MDAPPLPVVSAWSQDTGPAPADRRWPAGPRVEGLADSPLAALQRAREQLPGRDVLLLRADAWLPADAVQRLAAALAGGDWDVVSAVDDGWGLFDPALSAERRDALAWSLGEHASFAWGGWSALCSLWRADALATRDPADVDTLRPALLPCLYAGGECTPRDSIAPAPVGLLREQLGAGAAQSGIASARPVLLHVLHDWGGGIERFARDLAAGDDVRQHLLLVARSDEDRAPFGRRVCLHLDLDAPPLRTWTLSQPITDCSIHSPELLAVLDQVTREWGVGAVLVSSMVGLSLDVLRTGLPTAVCVHDAFPLWPVLHDERDPDGASWDLAALELALGQADDDFLFESRDACAWLALRAGFIAAALAGHVRLVAPSEFARRRLLAIAPVLANAHWDLLPHGIAALPRLPAPPSRAGAPLRVLVPGRITGTKGERLLRAMLATLPPDIELVLLGCGHRGEGFENDARVRVIRDYAHPELAARVAELAPDLALLPSTVAETFSYTLSEMLALGVPVLSASPGAPAERLAAAGHGWVVRPDAAEVNAMLARLAADRDLLAAERARPALRQPSLQDAAVQWRHVLPMAQTTPGLPAACANSLRFLSEHARAGQLAARVARDAQRLAGQLAELDDRAAWAHRLQAQIESLDSARQALATALEASNLEQGALRRQADGLQQHAEALEHQLAESYGYYQRDSADLARQRDVALGQRDVAVQELEIMQRSRVWRATALPRRIVTALRNRWLAGGYHLRHLKSLFGRGFASLRTRGLLGTWQRLRSRHAAIPAAALLAPPDEDPQGGAWRLPQHAQPRVSVVIPVYNHLDFSLACLRSLARAGDTTTMEVIVVDDCSSDESRHVLPQVPGLRYVRNAKNLGFIGACNHGASLATGEFIVFLNNDTTVRPGWLDALVATFTQHPDTGLAGSKLVYPDGRLQEAGGIVFSDGSGWNYGRFEDPEHPRFNFVREVDYCSGASIAMPRALFETLGGFDTLYTPAYYEDTDLAMRVRQHGLKVRYQPASVVVHHEGVSSGTDVSQGVKKHQLTNHVKFLARWRSVLAQEHAPPGSSPDRASDRGRRRQVLVLDACTPTPDRDSGSVRMLGLLKLLREQGCAVVFFPENRAHDGDYTRALQQQGVEAWWHPHLADVPSWLAANGSRFDVVIASRHYVLEPVLPLLRSHARRAHVVFDTVDLHHLRELREAEMANDPAKLRAAARTRRIELGLIGAVDTTWVVSGAEKTLLAEELPTAAVEVVSNIHEVRGRGLPFAERRDLLFVGSYRHPPNVDAALWLADEIFPRIRERLPALQLHLVGGDAPDTVVALGERPGIVFHGYVPDLDPLLEGSRISLAPLRYGAGVKGKVNQALSHGLPVVATTCAVEGMFLADGVDVLVADDVDAFAAAVARLHEDAALWETLSLGGHENTRRHFSSDAVRETLRTLLAGLGTR